MKKYKQTGLSRVLNKTGKLPVIQVVLYLFALAIALSGLVGCSPVVSSPSDEPSTGSATETDATPSSITAAPTSHVTTTEESSLDTSETSTETDPTSQSSDQTTTSQSATITQSSTTKPTTKVTGTTTVRPTTQTTAARPTTQTTTARPAATPTNTPTPTATPTPTTAAVSSDFPAKNYGTFFRDDYGKNSQLITSEDNSVTLDIGSSPYGVVLIRIDSNLIPENIRVKVLIRLGSLNYQYDVVKRGSFQGIPLQASGNCMVIVYKQIDSSGTSLAEVMTHVYSVGLASSLKPYTAASIISDFSRSSASVRQASSLCSGISTQTGRVEAVYNWIIKNIQYDTVLSRSITTDKTKYETYLPDPDRTFSTRKGICYDYASLMCAMLRSQGIPTRMIKGLVFGNSYHAWNEVFFEGYGWVVVASFRWIEINGTGWVLFDSTLAASGMTSEQIFNTAHTKQRVY